MPTSMSMIALRYALALLAVCLLLSCQRDANIFEKKGPEIRPLVPVETFRQDRGLPVRLSFELRGINGLAELRVIKQGTAFDTQVFAPGTLIAQYDLAYTVENLPDGTLIGFELHLTDQTGAIAEPFAFVVKVGPPFSVTDGTVAGQPVKVVQGRINRNLTLVAPHTYLMEGLVSVEENSTLTIEAGTTILMQTYPDQRDARLAITQGCRLIAEGTKDAPIVFTSARSLTGNAAWGDWAGIFVYGQAPTNQAAIMFEDGFTYGGNRLTESSGSLRYIRIEYAGKSDADAIQFFGVGSGTQIRYLQVWNCLDNGIRFKGGAADLKYAVVVDHGAYGLWAEHGWRGRAQFLVFQTAYAATIIPVNFNNIARSLELRNDASNFSLQPATYTYMSNITMIGNGNTDLDGTRRGFRVRRGAAGLFHNMIATNYPDDAVRVEDLPLERLDNGEMEIGHIHAWSNKTNYEELAETYFLPRAEFHLRETPVPGITPGNFVGSLPSPFDPATDPRFGNWFTPAPFIGAIENAENDWTADGNWCKNQDGSLR